ncbi:MAG: hypothetical protein KAT70_09565 [Thermoplasmata archaeon]|nr:hypothetical protein [Thermoplasmata archaeon]
MNVTEDGVVLIASVIEGDVCFSSSYFDFYAQTLDDAAGEIMVMRDDVVDEDIYEDLTGALQKINDAQTISYDYFRSFEYVKDAIEYLEENGAHELVDELTDAMGDVALSSVLYQEKDHGFDSTAEAWEKFQKAQKRFISNQYEAGIAQLRSALKKLPEPNTILWDKTTRVSHSRNTVSELLVYEDESMLHLGWLEEISEENHTLYARSTNLGRTWWIIDASEQAAPYLLYCGYDPTDVGLVLDITRTLSQIYVRHDCHYLYVPMEPPPDFPYPLPPDIPLWGTVNDPYFDQYQDYVFQYVGRKPFYVPMCTPGGIPNPPPKAPDLCVASISMPQYAFIGETVNINTVLMNMGDADVSGEVLTTLFVDGVLVKTDVISRFEANETSVYTFQKSWHSERLVEISQRIDPGITVEDGDTSNNILTRSLAVLDPLQDWDNDGLSNEEESPPGVYWFEGENCYYPGVTVEDDPLAGMGKVAVDGYWAVTASIWNQIAAGTYDVYMRAKTSIPGRTAKLEINTDGTRPDGIDWHAYFTLTEEYQWYKAPNIAFQEPNRILVRGGIATHYAPGPKDVYIDQFMFIPVDCRKMPTNPMDADTDRDGLSDGEEAPSGCYFFEGEDYAYPGVTIEEDPEAGFGLVAVDGYWAVTVSIWDQIAAGTYDVYMRAKTSIPGRTAKLEINTDGTSPGDIDWDADFILTEEYQWYKAPNIAFQEPNRILVRGGDQTSDPGPKDVYIDRFMLIPTAYNRVPTHPLDLDTDGDGLEDGKEVPGSPHAFVVDRFEYDDSPLTHEWGIYDGTGTVSTVYEEDRYGRVMRSTSGEGVGFGICLPEPVGTPFSSLPVFENLHFDMQANENFFFYVQVETTDGNSYYLRYDPDNDPLDTSISGYAIYGIGTEYRDGSWHTLERNLEQDIYQAWGTHYECTKGVAIRGGSYQIDNIYLHDGTAIYNSNPLISDTDGDGLEDGKEVYGFYPVSRVEAEYYVDWGPILPEEFDQPYEHLASSYYFVAFLRPGEMHMNIFVEEEGEYRIKVGAFAYGDPSTKPIPTFTIDYNPVTEVSQEFSPHFYTSLAETCYMNFTFTFTQEVDDSKQHTIRIQALSDYETSGAWLGIDYALVEKKGTNPTRPDLFLEIDCMSAKPSTDRNIEGTPHIFDIDNDAIDYLVYYYGELGIDVHPLVDEEVCVGLVDLDNDGIENERDFDKDGQVDVDEDTGTDGLADEDEPGYDSVTNPDPNGDNYDAKTNPFGTENNGILDPNEDVGNMDNRLDWQEDYDGNNDWDDELDIMERKYHDFDETHLYITYSDLLFSFADPHLGAHIGAGLLDFNYFQAFFKNAEFNPVYVEKQILLHEIGHCIYVGIADDMDYAPSPYDDIPYEYWHISSGKEEIYSGTTVEEFDLEYPGFYYPGDYTLPLVGADGGVPPQPQELIDLDVDDDGDCGAYKWSIMCGGSLENIAEVGIFPDPVYELEEWSTHNVNAKFLWSVGDLSYW